MSWTTPRTWSTGQIVIAAQLNTDIRDNTNFLYSGLNTMSLGSTAKVLDTEYQNTTGLIRFVLVTASTSAGSAINIKGYVGSTSPVTREVARFYNFGSGSTKICTISFFVPPTFYYTVSTAGAEALSNWTECNLHAT